MKKLTILIFSGDRTTVKDLLDDIVKLRDFNLNVRIVEWSKNKKTLIQKNKIYKIYKKKITNLKIFYDHGNWEYKYKRYINKFKSKYILLIGDDDRLNVNNFKKIFKYLELDYSGITLSFKNFQNVKQIKQYDIENLNDLNDISSFKLNRDLKKIGFTSCQIINVNLINKVYKKEKNYLLNSMYPQNFIILSIIKNFNNWKVLNDICIYGHFGSLEIFKLSKKELIKYIKIKDRLKSEYIGYFYPLKKNFSHLGEHEISRIYKDIFFNNIISWLFVSIKLIGKKKTYNHINKERRILKEPFVVRFTLFLIYVCPILFLDGMRICRKFFRKYLIFS